MNQARAGGCTGPRYSKGCIQDALPEAAPGVQIRAVIDGRGQVEDPLGFQLGDELSCIGGQQCMVCVDIGGR